MNGRGVVHIPDNHRLMIYKDQSIFPWHVDRNIIPNERLETKHYGRVGYCIYHNDNWLFVNEKLENLFDYTNQNNIRQIKKGEAVKLQDGVKLVVEYGMLKRLLLVQLVQGS